MVRPPGRPIEVRTDSRPGVGKPSHRRPNHLFRVVGVFLLVVGALAGGYLTFGRADHPSITGLAAGDDLPTPTLTGDGSGATSTARAEASAAAVSAAAQASRANALASRETQPANRSSARPEYSAPSSCKVYTGNKQIGCGLLLSAGFNIDQMPCLDKLWTKESHWNPKAENSSSGAYGIPQALPGDRMAAYGADWKTNPIPQIKWGLDYIKNRYGTPCNAWDHSQATGWY